jgi:MFS family permease
MLGHMTTEAPDAARARSRGLWRHGDFMRLWTGQAVSEIGSAVSTLALPLVAVVTLRATTLQVGLLSAASSLAFLLIALPAGAIVDRLAKRELMLWCDVARLVLVGSVPAAAIIGHLGLGQLYVVAVLVGVLTVFFDVAYQSYVPELVGRGAQLLDANGKLGVTQSFAQVAGPSIGGGLVGLLGAARAMTVDAASYLVSAVSLALIRTRPPEAQRGASDDGTPRRLRAEIAEGLGFVVKHPILRKVVACTGTSNLFSSMSSAILLVFLVRVLHVEAKYTGLLFSVGSVGGMAGGALFAPLAKRIGSARLIWLSILGFGVLTMLTPLARPGWGLVPFVIGDFSMSMSAVLYNVAQVSYRQAICPPELLGRMNASVRWIVWGTMPIGAAIGGALGSTLGVRTTIWISVIGCWLAGLWVLFSPLRRMRDVPLHAAYQDEPETTAEDGEPRGLAAATD